MTEPGGEGRVLQVNVSAGGVPKLRVREARVGPLGLDGDGHDSPWSHGGPLRAISLFAVEAIERVRAEGHPIGPGSTGENLTTIGIELARLEPGTRLAIGDEVLLEVTTPAMPCDTIKASFIGGKSGRISILTHPDDTRIYARVLEEGVVREGDRIRVSPADPASDAPRLGLLSRLEAVERHSAVARWSAAERLGYAIEWVDRGNLAYAVSRELDGPVFNSVHGMRVVPNLLPMVLEHFARAGATPWVHWPAEAASPWPGTQPVLSLDLHVASPGHVLAAAERPAPVAGVRVREIGPDESDAWVDAPRDPSAASSGAGADDPWRRTTPFVAATAGHHLFLAELDGHPVGSALLVVRGPVGLLRATSVRPDARRRGVHRALILARAEAATALGCDVISSHAEPGSQSSRNLRALGFGAIHRTAVFRSAPVVEAAPVG